MQRISYLNVSLALNLMSRPTQWAMRLSVVRLFALTVPLAWLGGRLAGTTGVFAGMLAASVVMGVIAWWQTRRLLVEVSSTT